MKVKPKTIPKSTTFQGKIVPALLTNEVGAHAVGVSLVLKGGGGTYLVLTSEQAQILGTRLVELATEVRTLDEKRMLS